MGIPENIKKVPTWMWKVFVGVGTAVGVVWGIIQFWTGIEGIIQDNVKESTIKITAEIIKSEHNIGSFLVDDLRERIIVIEDEISYYKSKNKPVPIYLKRKLRMMHDRLKEGIQKWGE